MVFSIGVGNEMKSRIVHVCANCVDKLTRRQSPRYEPSLRRSLPREGFGTGTEGTGGSAEACLARAGGEISFALRLPGLTSSPHFRPPQKHHGARSTQALSAYSSSVMSNVSLDPPPGTHTDEYDYGDSRSDVTAAPSTGGVESADGYVGRDDSDRMTISSYTSSVDREFILKDMYGRVVNNTNEVCLFPLFLYYS